MEYEAEQQMEADGRMVFEVAADVSAMHQWLPGEIHVQQISDDLAEGTSNVGNVLHDDVLLRMAPQQLRLEWGSRRRPDYTGWLQVMEHPDGGSSVVAHLSFLGDQPEATGSEQVRQATKRLLEQSLDRLAEEVGRRATQH
ncbi:SRPBCC family protein [Actinomadura macrotermitis]|uniref:Polyketide cyclase / dehydrase and lipid transport n=1 Tax=Actinomadura macrotermitis TaxID=2585200 RepID=A0A7K0BZD9_9ACTN|nr:SRPBCC family protein [Actinomadura macrotermitis]MQY06549.1 hypothetical protein [Actinomadura macrotermitis]